MSFSTYSRLVRVAVSASSWIIRDRSLTAAISVRIVFRCWMVLFGLVGAQMGWVLRPFIGDPDRPFTWFRPRESNFFGAVYHALINLFW